MLVDHYVKRILKAPEIGVDACKHVEDYVGALSSLFSPWHGKRTGDRVVSFVVGLFKGSFAQSNRAIWTLVRVVSYFKIFKHTIWA